MLTKAGFCLQSLKMEEICLKSCPVREYVGPGWITMTIYSKFCVQRQSNRARGKHSGSDDSYCITLFAGQENNDLQSSLVQREMNSSIIASGPAQSPACPILWQMREGELVFFQANGIHDLFCTSQLSSVSEACHWEHGLRLKVKTS